MSEPIEEMFDQDLVSGIMASRIQISRFLKEVDTEWATIHTFGDFVAQVVYERRLCVEAKKRGIRIAAWEIGGP